MTLNEYLTLANVSQRAFAEGIDISTSIVSRWRSGERVPSRLNINLIAENTKGAVTWNDWNSTNH